MFALSGKLTLHFVDLCHLSAGLSEMNARLTLVGEAGAHADVSHIARLHDVVQSLHGLFDRSVVVKAMTYRSQYQLKNKSKAGGHTLENIDIIELHAGQACFHGVEYMLPSDKVSM